VRDGDRRPRDSFSSRGEFVSLRASGLLRSETVIVHGTALEASDFAAMRAAGAKLVWSPLSNLLLYGKTANVSEALARGVLVSLGTDWAPSGSPTLLEELKVADLLVVSGSARNPYRSLIDATERDVRLVTVGGDPLAGDVGVVRSLKGGDFETVRSERGRFSKAIDVTKARAPTGP
jgi:5-methylthioadenosine/S-adenosylhomocysteine deaminase